MNPTPTTAASSPAFGYRPAGTTLKDTWYFPVGDRVHTTFMQERNTDDPSDQRSFCTLGQAVTDDLITWRPLPTALVGGPAGSYDDKRLHTGSTFAMDGRYHMFYSAKGSAQDGQSRIALATSADGVTWTRHPANPILSPDPRYYFHEGNRAPLCGHAWPHVDCRDLHVVPDPAGRGFWGYYAARSPADEVALTSVIALCHSDDLVTWRQFPPCFMPDRYGCVEVPDVFELGGRWFMLCMTGNMFGHRYTLGERTLNQGTFYAVADHPRGPFVEPADNILLGSIANNGFCCRTLVWRGETRLLHTTGKGAIALPKILRADAAGRLRAYYDPTLDRYAGETLVPHVHAPALPNDGRWGSKGTWTPDDVRLRGHCKTDWALHIFEPTARDFVYRATVRIDNARAAGLVFRLQGDNAMDGAYVVLLDAEAGEVVFTATRTFPLLDLRKFSVQRGRDYRLTCLMHDGQMELYIDDELIIQCHAERFVAGRLGLFVERGAATFGDLNINPLNSPSSYPSPARG